VKTKITEKGTKETKSTFGYKFYAVSDESIPGVSAVEVTACTHKEREAQRARPDPACIRRAR
jgi:hypothetical protein